MSLWGYHHICRYALSRRPWFSIPKHSSLKLGTVRYFPGSDYAGSIEVASIPYEINASGWDNSERGLILANGWTRISSAEVDDVYESRVWDYSTPYDWLSQANHIFKDLNIVSSYEDYAFLDRVRYRLSFSGPINGLAAGYLFLCPFTHLQTNDSTRFQHPECPAYWSLDSSGVEQLGTEEAENLGFPSVELEMEARRTFWDERVYSGLRQFHKGKGFDPFSQDVARHLGLQLFQFVDGLAASVAHGGTIELIS
ncbi:hypothetical protein B0H17DRAFT_334097 [Mycena rosella]|uniref:Uncharacterized protein n=1 Tax=Mycena rosella TaxID=1033263 RepID=A0AAD7CS88_MYCRO|nr:hypothetical protein B0H17DRAFT_334097 [Mycena rosella]